MYAIINKRTNETLALLKSVDCIETLFSTGIFDGQEVKIRWRKI